MPNNDYIEVDVIKYRLIFALEERFAKPLIRDYHIDITATT